MIGRLALATAMLSALSACGPDDEAHAGKACLSDLECGSLICSLDERESPRDLDSAALACTEPRDGQPPGAECEQASDCDHGLCLLAGACALPCDGDVDCARDEHCLEVFARTAEDALQSLQACIARVDLPSGASVRSETRAGVLSPGDTEVAVEPLADGRTFVVLEHSDPTWPSTFCTPPLCLRTLRGDDGEPLFDAALDYASEPPPLVPVATGDRVDPIVLRLPTEGEAGASTRYRAGLTTEHAGDLSLTRVARSERGQALDLNVFYVGALALSPDGDALPPVLADALDAADAILGQAGIYIDDVRQIAVRGELPMRGTYFPEDGPDAGPWQGFTLLKVKYGSHVELPGLFRLSAGAANSAINLFLLSDIEARMPDAQPEAEAGGIPGPPGMHGTAGSGIAFATDMMVGNPAAFGRTLAHEIAHYLGLFHTSERDGRVLDALEDTEECRLEQDAADDGLDGADCAGFGADNLMFWGVASGTVLTEEQRAVLAESPLLH